MKSYLTLLLALILTSSVVAQTPQIPAAKIKDFIDKTDPREVLLKGSNFSLSYDERSMTPSWAFVELNKPLSLSSQEVKENEQPLLKTADEIDYYHSGYAFTYLIDTIHLNKGTQDYAYLSHYRNAFPLEFASFDILSDLNSNIHLFATEKTKIPERIFLIEGLVKGKKTTSFGHHEVQVPEGVFVIVLRTSMDLQFKTYIAFYIPESAGLKHFRYYACTVDDIEKMTSYKLFATYTQKQGFVKSQFFLYDFEKLLGEKPNADDDMDNQLKKY